MGTAQLKGERKKVFQSIMNLLQKLGELKCSYCGTLFTYTDVYTTPTIDHIISRHNDGSNHISNLTPACITCNKRKSSSKSWIVTHQNYGFGVQGSVKGNYPLAWKSPDDILYKLQSKLRKKRIEAFFSKIKSYFNIGVKSEISK